MEWKLYSVFNYEVLEKVQTLTEDSVTTFSKTHTAVVKNIDELISTYPFMMYFDWMYYLDNSTDIRDFITNICTKYEKQLDTVLNIPMLISMNHFILQGHRERRKYNFFHDLFRCCQYSTLVKLSGSEPKLTVIIPTFNRESMIGTCIKSILNQTYKNLEVIVVNDGSTDKTLEIISKFSSDTRVTIINNAENIGCYESIKLALAISSGEFITTHGSDDISVRCRFERIMSVLINDNLKCCGNYIWRTHSKYLEFDTNAEKLFVDYAVHNKPCNHGPECCKPLVALGILTFHRSVFDVLTYNNVRKGGDMIFFEQYLALYEGIFFGELDCVHRFLSANLTGKTYKVIEEILYLSCEFDKMNITSQNIEFDKTYRNKIKNDINRLIVHSK